MKIRTRRTAIAAALFLALPITCGAVTRPPAPALKPPPPPSPALAPKPAPTPPRLTATTPAPPKARHKRVRHGKPTAAKLPQTSDKTAKSHATTSAPKPLAAGGARSGNASGSAVSPSVPAFQPGAPAKKP